MSLLPVLLFNEELSHKIAARRILKPTSLLPQAMRLLHILLPLPHTEDGAEILTSLPIRLITTDLQIFDRLVVIFLHFRSPKTSVKHSDMTTCVRAFVLTGLFEEIHRPLRTSLPRPNSQLVEKRNL